MGSANRKIRYLFDDLAEAVLHDADEAAKALKEAGLDPDAVAREGRAFIELLQGKASEAEENPVRDLARRLQRARGREDSKTQAKPPFKRAAVLAWVVYYLVRVLGEVRRYRAGKTAYLLERGLGLGLFTTHTKKPWGPYDSNLKYKDAEPIARGQRWLITRRNSSYIELGSKIQKALQYAHRYLKDEELAIDYIKYLATYTDDELETITTVDWIALELSESGEEVYVETIREAIGRSKEWEEKLGRENFSHASIAKALRQLQQIGLLTHASGIQENNQ